MLTRFPPKFENQQLAALSEYNASTALSGLTALERGNGLSFSAAGNAVSNDDDKKDDEACFFVVCVCVCVCVC